MFGRTKLNAPQAPDAAGAARFAPKSPSEALKPSAPPPPPPPRIRKPRGGLLSMMSEALTLGLFLAGAGVAGVLSLEHEASSPGPLPEDKVVVVPKGAGTSEVAALLEKENVIDAPGTFELYSYLNRSRGALKAGEFQFKARGSVEQAISTLIDGKPILHSVTLPEGLTSEQIVQRLRDSDVLTGEVTEVPREGSLLPDTYKVERGMSRQQLVNEMQSAQRRILAQAWSKRAPDLAIKTAPELVILASIVEKETGRADERPRVAGVFVNRLSRRMKLQSDPTIVYGLVGGKGTLGRGITRAEIDRATPYNTYVIEGLPPGPIANPGRAALEAVANPIKTRDLYFVADGTGGHAFAETYDQHLRNVARWRALEQARGAGAVDPAQVDRVDSPAVPENRTELDRSSPLPAGASAYAAMPSARATPLPDGSASRAFDASEGTPKDPLQNTSWDLNSPKTVPSFGSASGANPAARRTAQQPRPKPKPARAVQSAEPVVGDETGTRLR